MKNVLLYVEPHPLRDSYEEFYSIGNFLGNLLYETADRYRLNLRIFSNNHVIDRLSNEHPALSSLCIRPTASENTSIEQYATGWDDQSILEWVKLTSGDGQSSVLYFDILKRIYSLYEFDVVLLWAENGAVRKFCREKDIAVVHGELGPTRLPFEETVYFDALGTNGNASIVKFPDTLYGTLETVPPETWICAKGAAENNPENKGIIDAPYTLVVDEYKKKINFPYVYIPLQLADDLNTLQHSSFKNPVDFLEKIVPCILAQGYGVVIKPHPGAVSRPYNLSFESRALKLARSYGEKVVVLERSVTTTRALGFMANADAVCTINSSVGYEALLLGKKLFLMGDAAYDVGGKLKCGLDELSKIDSHFVDSASIERLTSLLSGHFLFPKSLLQKDDYLYKVLKFHFENRISKNHNDFWRSWLLTMRPGYDSIIKKVSLMDELPAIIGNVEFLKSKKVAVFEDECIVRFSGVVGRNDILVKADVDEKAFFGFIDKVTSVVDSGKTKVVGWALDKNLIPPVTIVVSVGGSFRSMHRVVVPRKDVVGYLESSFGEKLNGKPTESSGFQFEIELGSNAASDVSLYLLSASSSVKKISLVEGPIHSE